MKNLFLLLCLLAVTVAVRAQDRDIQELKKEASQKIKKEAVKDTIPKIWRTGGLFTFVFGQTSLSNWAAGGDNLSLNINSFLNLHAFYKKDKNAWDNNLDMAVGYLKTSSSGTRKSDDRIDLLSKYGYQVAKQWYLTALVNFRSQFFPGYNYPTDTTEEKISNFLAPAYLLASVGIDWKPTDYFSVFVSPVSSRWVIVRDKDLSARGAYGVDTGKTSMYQIGAYLSALFQHDIIRNVNYNAKLDLFSNYQHNPQDVDVYMTNLVNMKINSMLTATLALDIIYDDDVRIFGPDKDAARTQLRENIGIGFSAKF